MFFFSQNVDIFFGDPPCTDNITGLLRRLLLINSDEIQLASTHGQPKRNFLNFLKKPMAEYIRKRTKNWLFKMMEFLPELSGASKF